MVRAPRSSFPFTHACNPGSPAHSKIFSPARRRRPPARHARLRILPHLAPIHPLPPRAQIVLLPVAAPVVDVRVLPRAHAQQREDVRTAPHADLRVAQTSLARLREAVGPEGADGILRALRLGGALCGLFREVVGCGEIAGLKAFVGAGEGRAGEVGGEDAEGVAGLAGG